MSTVLKMNELNQIGKGVRLFSKDEGIRCIGMIVKGSIRIHGNGMLRIAMKGEIIGIADMYEKQYLADYITEEDAIFYAIPVINNSLLDAFMVNNVDYRGIIVHSMALELTDYLNERENLLGLATKVYEHCGDGSEETIPRAAFQLECSEEKVAGYRDIKNIPLEEMYYHRTGNPLYAKGILTNMKYLEDRFASILTAAEQKEELQAEPDEEIENPMPLLKNSLFQILKYAQVPDAEQKEIVTYIHAFVNANDRLSTQDDMRKLKKQITGIFYKLFSSGLKMKTLRWQ